MAAFQRQSWSEEACELWVTRLTSWVKLHGARNVESVAEWAIDNQADLADGKIDIATFKARLAQDRPAESGDGPFVMCRLCRNTGFYAVRPGDDRSRYAKCPHPPDKAEIGWDHKYGVDIPPGETMDSMRANYLEFMDLMKGMAKEKRA